MSFLDSIVGIGKSALGFLGGSGIGNTLARTALLGYALNRVNKSMNKDNKGIQDQGTTVTLQADTQHKVPILYGSAFVPGKIIDAQLSSDNKTMWVAVVLCEKTGNLIDGTASAISFNEVHIDGFRLGFQSDGVTVENIYDSDGNSSNVWSGLIKVYPFNDGSNNATSFTSETSGNSTSASSLMPGWTSSHTMNGLVFALVRLQYNKTQKLTTVGSNITFKLTNTMTKPGDVLNDYMQNTTYGAGIASNEVDIV